ncbi:TylF/MycF/NovP-related O-methyltransferase [Pseudodesulfovibrio senegalensis]|uniref:dTDP-6-deoxy-L-hexose 3-O-methyltransferase n=1 Tax=Pseudodesulfovibrio senegalensis TaxID=1721087 RepID=A0A6N6N120_9BACT|nr:TylF/MycF/NovP-related O-methyltransferase [Pseudodesulfovibrio senegalensis]KAB1441291.1 dTDP-6-deoxy-L-hexose 3-O-methyltransferase [Pseudodesulfovibrio senegalensis]
MIALPDFAEPFDYENGFYLTCQSRRVGRLLAHYELYKMSLGLAGDIVECGVFKGASFVRWGMFRDLFETQQGRKLFGFDSFGTFPATNYEADKAELNLYLEEAGDQSISTEQLDEVLANKGISNYELIKGDINETVPRFVEERPEVRISLLNLDTDVYEPAVTILEHLYPKIVSGGILILDDYGVFPGETAAVDEYFAGQDVEIRGLGFSNVPCYIIKS